MYNHMREHLIVNQPEGEKFYMGAMGHFNSPEGWDFELTVDGQAVEVKMHPMTVADYKKFESNIQDAIFVSAANVGAHPALYLGGGHINIGLQELLHDPLHVRNFIVDFINHAELSMGIMNYDTNNALPHALGLPQQWQQLKDVISEFDKTPNPETFDVYLLAHNINSIYSGSGGLDDEFHHQWGLLCRGKYTAISFFRLYSNIPEIARIEIRSVRPQTSIDTFNHQISLFRGRLKYLKNIRQPIPLKLEVNLKNPIFPTGEHRLTPPIDPQEALRAFYRYVTESGELWKDHRSYIWPQWLSDGELEKFENSEWFKEKARVCASLLK
jgi:hypothetical protein